MRQMLQDAQNGETILLVEDQPEVSEVVTNMLRSSGYRVLPFLSPMEALQAAANDCTPIHLLITDNCMPEMHGVEFAERFRVIRPNCHILFVTGSIDSDILEKFPEAHLMQKPFDAHQLRQKVREVLDNRRAA